MTTVVKEPLWTRARARLRRSKPEAPSWGQAVDVSAGGRPLFRGSVRAQRPLRPRMFTALIAAILLAYGLGTLGAARGDADQLPASLKAVPLAAEGKPLAAPLMTADERARSGAGPTGSQNHTRPGQRQAQGTPNGSDAPGSSAADSPNGFTRDPACPADWHGTARD